MDDCRSMKHLVGAGDANTPPVEDLCECPVRAGRSAGQHRRRFYTSGLPSGHRAQAAQHQELWRHAAALEPHDLAGDKVYASIDERCT